MSPTNTGTDRAKEVKVKIPLKYHIKLHSVKVLTGREISATVTAALGEYFHTLASQGGSTAGIDLRQILGFEETATEP